MNDEAARQGRPATTSVVVEGNTAAGRHGGGGRVNRPALVVALEALEVGNTNLAIAILFDLIDGADEPPPANRARCRGCRMEFRWPGLRDRHEVFCSALESRAA